MRALDPDSVAAFGRRERIRDRRPPVAVGVNKIVPTKHRERLAGIKVERDGRRARRFGARRSRNRELAEDPEVELAPGP